MTKVNPKNRNETKSDIFSLYLFKSDAIFFLPKNKKVFQSLTKSKILSFMIKVKPNNENETKSDIFPSDIFKSDVKFH